MQRKIIIGTRGSELALWQANYTRELLAANGIHAELKIIETEGDRSQAWETSFDKIEGKGFFTKELEEALLQQKIDLAVHSHKDLPTKNPEGLIIAGVSQREDPSELLIIRKDSVDEKQKFFLRLGATVGTSSPRRKSQLLGFRPDVQIKDIRGNVPTRVRKLREGQFDAILLAAAGIERLQLSLDDLHVEKLSPREFVPAPAQGVLAWQIREKDTELLELLESISDLDTRVRISIERELLRLFDGGCQLPLGAYCDSEPGENDRLIFRLWVSVADSWDKQPKQFFAQTFDTDGFADEVYAQLQQVRSSSVFITRDSRRNDYFTRALTNLGFVVQAQSLIEFKPVALKELPKTDWIFFSSRHAVKYFFMQKPQVGAVKYGCIGTGTSAELRQHGKRADFIGQSTDTRLVGKQFASRIGNAKVLFPIARGSLQTVQQQIPRRDNVFNAEVYATLKKPVVLQHGTSILVFTSPSNVEAFYEKNAVSSGQQVIAIGEATGKALERKGVKKYTMPAGFEDLDLVRAVLAVSVQVAGRL